MSLIALSDQVRRISALLRLPAADSKDAARLAEELVQASTKIARDPRPAWQRSLGLTDSATQVVWLLAVVAIDPVARAALQARADLDDDPDIAAIARIVYGAAPSRDALRELGPEGTLRKLGVIERCDDGGADLHDSRCRWALSRRMLALLHGDTSLDPALASFVRTPDGVMPLDELAASVEAVTMARDAVRSERAVVVASGMPGLGRRTLLVAAAAEAGIAVLEIDTRKLAKAPEKQLRAIARECKLTARVPLLANLGAEHVEAIGEELVAQLDGAVLVTTGVERCAIRWNRPVIAVELAQPTSAQRARQWLTALGSGTEGDGELLADRYPLAPALVQRAADATRARAVNRALTPADIQAGVRAVLDDKLGQFARRVMVTQSWDDLVLPSEQLDPIVELLARVRRRRRVYEHWGFADKVGKGLGVSALFSGPPGTGKTMVAALMAKDLGLELYQVDLGKLVSKWIGETEKQLGALFDAAEAGHAVLLFDEADSLFGKRTEVKSSNDRYANLETNYLLQRLETFTGICLLTTNHESGIDPAFRRRLSLHVRFDMPDEAERARLWRAVLPVAAPVDEVDFMRLALRYEMSGGHIKNAALRAAFLAADEDRSISEAHLDRAARVEYEALGKIAA